MKERNRLGGTAALSLVLSFLVGSVAQAQPSPDAWTFTATPYAWLMGVSGSVTAKGRTVDINAGITDLFAKTDTLVALMANMEARREKWAFGLDFIFTQMTASAGIAAQRNPVPWLNLSANAGANVKSTMMVLEGTAGYELVKPAPTTSIEGLVGVRYWHAITDMSFGFNATGTVRTPDDVGLFTRSIGVAGASTGSMDWADPIFGLRLRHELAPHHRVQVRGDIGGFGVGSQFTWQTLAAYSYEFSSGTTAYSAVLGYRALGVNYSAGWGNDARSLDLVLHGPILGLSIKW
ncbi:MAG: hypothetical protein JSR47_09190 [Proteobacteria bacterium]|nr:hypothetical protein [Pseudomonadota bacterium]